MIGAGVLGLARRAAVAAADRRLPGDRHAVLRRGVRRVHQQRGADASSEGRTASSRSIRCTAPTFRSPALTGYFYVLLGLLVLSMIVLHMLDTSRMGRAWRAVREDPLAASAMTVPVNRVKLMAFAFGAMIAAMAGAVFAAQQTSVFPTNFDTPYLILIYAGLILGGAGSMSGAVLGGLIVSIVLDGFLRSPNQSGYIFYGVILITLLVKLRPWGGSRSWSAARSCSGLSPTRSWRRSRPTAVAGDGGGQRLDRPALGDRAGQPGDVRQHLLRGAALHGGRPDPGAPALADDPAHPDAVPGRLRLGGAPVPGAGDHPPAPARRDPDRGDGVAAVRIARRSPAWRSCNSWPSSNSTSCHSTSAACAPLRARPGGRRGRDRQRDRPERRREDVRVQRDHRAVRADRRRCPLRRQVARRAQAPPGHPVGRRADLPEPAPVPQHDRVRERDRRDLRPNQGHADRADLPPAPGPARGARGAAPRPRRSWRSSVSAWPATAGTSRPTACPTPTGGAWRSHAPWPRGRACCCSTSPRPA